MKNLIVLTLVVAVSLSLTLTGCGAKKAESSKEAITQAKAMETTEEKAAYLISQAKAFYNSKEFQGSVDIAQYVLRYVDRDSEAARDLLDKAKDALAEEMKKAASEAKTNFGF